ncbi:MAG TPA: metallophosphoesterase family protein [Ktedonobacteraceae bacterium]|nr:metallophosphoesterase family protein [Ktedonobacteraceae bacterium]
MKIAALYDIHGNLHALNAVLTELQEIQPDLIIVGGDIVSGPMPRQTLERLFQSEIPVRYIRGNGDREVVTISNNQPLKRRFLPEASDKSIEEIRWIVNQLTSDQRDFLAALPEQLTVQVEGLGIILFCHATVRNDEEIFTPLTPEKDLQAIFSNLQSEIVVCGHTHMQFERRLNTLRIVNAGSVGMPYADQPGAYWLLLGPEGYEHKRTAYDEKAAAEAIKASEYPPAKEFAEENILTVPTAAEATEVFEQMALKYRL